MGVMIEQAANRTICILGGSGFVGHHLVMSLKNEGYQVRIITRHRERHRDLLVIPGIEVIEGDIHDIKQLRKYFTGCVAVINLAAIRHERHKGEFQEVHVVLTSRIIQACENTGVQRLLHVSALNAGCSAETSRYLHSKGLGENLVRQAANRLDVTVFRPAVIFGQDDKLFNRFALLLRAVPLFFPVICGETRLAPVYVEDVVKVMVDSLNDEGTFGQVYELCGPDSYSMKEIVDMTASLIGVRRFTFSLGRLSSAIVARLLPARLFTHDTFLSLKKDEICDDSCSHKFGIELHSVEAIVPSYLSDVSARGHYDNYRRHARRDD